VARRGETEEAGRLTAYYKRRTPSRNMRGLAGDVGAYALEIAWIRAKKEGRVETRQATAEP